MRKLLILIPILAVSTLAACGGGGTTTTTTTRTTTVPVTTTTTSATTTTRTTSATTTTTSGNATSINAAALYTTNCAACHGANRQGVGTTFPALTPTSLADDSEASIAQTIANGVTGTAMSAWSGKLTQDQINALAHYLKTVAP